MQIKINPDKERAKSIFNLVIDREKSLKHLESMKNNGFSTIIAENYYEIIKELCVSIALNDGHKFIGENAHKELISFMTKYGLNGRDLVIIDDLRVKRNRSSYEGKKIEQIYLENNKNSLREIINKLKEILTKEINKSPK